MNADDLKKPTLPKQGSWHSFVKKDQRISTFSKLFSWRGASGPTSQDESGGETPKGAPLQPRLDQKSSCSQSDDIAISGDQTLGADPLEPISIQEPSFSETDATTATSPINDLDPDSHVESRDEPNPSSGSNSKDGTKVADGTECDPSSAQDSSLKRQSTLPNEEGPKGRTDILWCLIAQEEGKTDRTFYKDTRWKGVNNGLPDYSPDGNEEEDSIAVLAYFIYADIVDKTQKQGNTIWTWREDKPDFELGPDAVLQRRYWPHLKLFSKRLISVVENILDYYPYRGKLLLFHIRG
jgi:hypothetical protein